jgi:hypothetical protein
MFFVFVFIFQEFVLCVESWSMRRWHRHLVGFGRKALSLLFEGVFQSEIPRVDGRGGEGERGRRNVRTVQKTTSEQLRQLAGSSTTLMRIHNNSSQDVTSLIKCE